MQLTVSAVSLWWLWRFGWPAVPRAALAVLGILLAIPLVQMLPLWGEIVVALSPARVAIARGGVVAGCGPLEVRHAYGQRARHAGGDAQSGVLRSRILAGLLCVYPPKATASLGCRAHRSWLLRGSLWNFPVSDRLAVHFHFCKEIPHLGCHGNLYQPQPFRRAPGNGSALCPGGNSVAFANGGYLPAVPGGCSSWPPRRPLAPYETSLSLRSFASHSSFRAPGWGWRRRW